jgi:uncharacterized protein involved in exopolysaccharide biosynthesis
LDTGERLKALRAQYVSVSAYLLPDHPDIIKLKQELDSLEKETGGTDERDELSKRLTAARAALADLRERANDVHPDVVRTQEVVVSLERELQAAGLHPATTSAVKPENPAYINLQSQLASTQAMLDSLESARTDLKRRMAEHAKRLEATPAIEPTYLDLIRDRENSVHKYQEITSRLMEAQVSAELEVQRKGERFSLINPPELPEKPDRPNRLAILLLGAFLAVGGGIGAGVAVDNIDRTIHTVEQFSQALQGVTLAVIPYLPSEDELISFGRRRTVLGFASLGAVIVGAVVLHLAWMPLDVLWYTIWRKLG